MSSKNRSVVAKVVVFGLVGALGCVSLAACSGGNAESAGGGSATTSASAGSTATPTATEVAAPTPTLSVTTNRNVNDAIALAKSKFKVLEEPVPVTGGNFVVAQNLLASGEVLWNTARQVHAEKVYNFDLFLQSRDGTARPMVRGNKRGDQWQVVATDFDGETAVWRSTRSTLLVDEDWRITVKQGEQPAKNIVSMDDVDKRIGERPVTLDSDTSVAISGNHVVWTVSPAMPYPDADGKVDEEKLNKILGSGLEWWHTDINNPEKVNKVVVDAAFPSVRNGVFYGLGGAKNNKTGKADTVMSFDPKTGAVENVITIELQKDERPTSFCASDSFFAIGTLMDSDEPRESEDEEEGGAPEKPEPTSGAGRVVVFTENKVVDSVDLNFDISAVRCGDDLVGVAEGASPSGMQYLFDTRGEGRLIKLGAHPGFGRLYVAGRHAMWTVPDSKGRKRAQYAMARDL